MKLIHNVAPMLEEMDNTDGKKQRYGTGAFRREGKVRS